MVHDTINKTIVNTGKDPVVSAPENSGTVEIELKIYSNAETDKLQILTDNKGKAPAEEPQALREGPEGPFPELVYTCGNIMNQVKCISVLLPTYLNDWKTITAYLIFSVRVKEIVIFIMRLYHMVMMHLA